MDWDIALHVGLRVATMALSLAAFGYGALRALAVRGDVWRRALRLVGTLVLLSVATLTTFDAVLVLRLGVVPEDDLLDWISVALDVLVPVFFLLLIESWRRRDRLETELAALSETDPLTGLPNRRGFVARALPAIAAARRDGRDCSVLMVDLDRFKAINDGFGHPAGDAVLRGVGSAIARAVRAADVAGRLGGEEFALLLPGDDPAAAGSVAERLRALVADAVPHPAGDGARVTLSAGIAALGGAMTLEAALAAADRALYAAKAAGRDRVVIA